MVDHRFVAGQRDRLAAMAAVCRRVAAGELTTDGAARSAPFPEDVARQALARAAPSIRGLPPAAP